MNINIKRKQILIGLSLLVCAYLAFDLSRDGRPEVQKAFDERVQARLKSPGDTALVSDLNPGAWTEVCWLDEYTTAEAAASYKFGRPQAEIITKVNTIDTYGDGFIFYYPPETVEIFKIPKSFALGMPKVSCQPRAVAKFTVENKSVEFKGEVISRDVLELSK